MKPLRVVLGVLLLAPAAVALDGAPAGATTLTVTTTSDDAANNAVCSLREAILNANADNETAEDSCGDPPSGADTIVLSAGLTYTLSVTGTSEDGALTGDLDVISGSNVTIVGNGATVDGGDFDRLFHALSGSTLTISDLTIQNGSTIGTGSGSGGVHVAGTVTLENVTIRDNLAGGDGGGIGMSGGTLTLTNSRIVDNGTSANGGGIEVGVGTATITDTLVSGNHAEGKAGGVYSNNSVTGSLTRSLVFDNDSTEGGGIYADSANFRLENVTVSGNDSIQDGGGVYVNDPLDANNVTVTANRADSVNAGIGRGGGIFTTDTTTLSNSIVSGNVDVGTTPGPDCFESVGSVTSAGYSLVRTQNAQCTVTAGTGDLPAGTNPLLGALTDLDGPTKVHPLLFGSPAVNAGNPLSPTGVAPRCETTDQRGATRPIGAACDMGAVERDPTPAMSINDPAAVTEPGTSRNVTFNLTLNRTAPDTVTVKYATQNSSALAGLDYVAKSGTVTFQPGQTFKTVTVQVLGDSVDEPTQRFRVVLSNVSAATLADAVGVGTILDDDRAPLVRIGNVSLPERDSDARAFRFAVRLSAVSEKTIRLHYRTVEVDGGARSPGDFRAKEGDLRFPPGDTRARVRVRVFGDTQVEPDEIFLVRLGRLVNVRPGDVKGRGTIQNDD